MSVRVRRAAVAGLAGLLLPFAVRAAGPEDARRAYDAGRFTDAMGIWQQLSRSGDAQADFGLGLVYDLGNGVKQDSLAAFIWYRKAAEAGLPQAEFNLGVMYDAGRGVVRDSGQAALWYAKAAAHGDARAEFDLAMLYEAGDGIPRNPAAAAAWYGQAAEHGVPAAQDRVKALRLPRQTGGGSALSGVVLAAPARETSITVADGQPQVELVWTAPPQPQPVRYEVIVRDAGNGDPGAPAMQPVYTASVTQTAVLARLPERPAFYVWDVETVGRDGSRATSDWSWFSVEGSPGAERSVQVVR